jgi:anti-anti-sigma factor
LRGKEANVDEAMLRSDRLREDVWVVTLEGEYDLANADQVEEALERAFDAGNTLILDLRPTTFIDSVVIGKIANVRLRADSSRGTHRLAVVVDRYSHPARILELALDRYLDTYDDLHAALTAGRVETACSTTLLTG